MKIVHHLEMRSYDVQDILVPIQLQYDSMDPLVITLSSAPGEKVQQRWCFDRNILTQALAQPSQWSGDGDFCAYYEESDCMRIVFRNEGEYHFELSVEQVRKFIQHMNSLASTLNEDHIIAEALEYYLSQISA